MQDTCMVSSHFCAGTGLVVIELDEEGLEVLLLGEGLLEGFAYIGGYTAIESFI